MSTRHDRDTPATAASSRRGVFTDAVRAELTKVRTLRSTGAFVAGGMLVTGFGAVFLALLVQSYDASSPDEQSRFETVDPTVVTMPFVMFCIGAIGALIITSEFTTGTIGAALTAVPQRRILLGAKVIVAAWVGVACGVPLALLSFVVARSLLGDRPAPFNPWPHWTDGIPTALGGAVMVLVACLVGLGLGTLLRSTAAALTTLVALVLVAPIFAHFLPAPWELRFASILLPNLIQQLAGGNHPYAFSPAGAAGVAAGYVLLTLGAGAIGFGRRDV